jgi:sugar (pentulose or hexulose) kinase
VEHGYILSLDCGTQSVRSILFDCKGHIVGEEKIEIEPYFSDNPGWAEQDPEVYWQSLSKACICLKEKHEEAFEAVIGVVLTTLRDTVINLDKNGKVLRPGILWLDQRMAKCSDPVPLVFKAAYLAVGMLETVEITRRKSKANWIKENQPEVWKKTYKYLLLSGYLTYKFTGRMVDSSASQIGHIPFDYKNKRWPGFYGNFRWSMFGIEKEKLPELIEPGQNIGGITEEASLETGIKAGTPFIACGSDKSSETLGVGCLNAESASLSFGTTATAQVITENYIEALKFMPSYPSVVPGRFNPEAEIFRGYWMISWFKKEFASKEMVEAKEKCVSPELLLNERLSHIPPGCQGLMLQPYWGPGLKMPTAKGSIIGFGDVHTRAHIYRAIIEGINFGLMDGLHRIEAKTGVKVQKLMVSGGGSQSEAICQITSDMFELPVYKGETCEASALGAALSGFVALGVYGSYEEAALNMVRHAKVFTPNTGNSAIYRRLYNDVYKKIYPRLEGLYKEIQKITGYPEVYR